MVLQGGSVAEDGRTLGALDDLAHVSGPNVTIETGPSRELRVTLIALKGLL